MLNNDQKQSKGGAMQQIWLGLGQKINHYLGIRKRDWPILTLMLFHVFLTLSITISLRSINSGLLLSAFSPTVYPWYFLAESIVAFGLSVAYSRLLSGRVSVWHENIGFLGFFAGVLMIGRLFLFLNQQWIYFALPVFCDALAAILLLQAWGLYSDCIDSRKARRLFPLVGLGGTCGSIFGGWLASSLAQPMGTANLLYLELFLLAGLCLAVTLLQENRLDEPAAQSVAPQLLPDTPNLELDASDRETSLWQVMARAVRPLLANRLLLLVLLIMLCVRISSTIMDYLLQLQLKSGFSQNEITAFMGSYFALTSLVTLVVQLFVENRLIQKGIVWGMASTPVSLSLGMLGVLFSPSLITVTLTKFIEQITRYSLFKTAVELVYVPFDSSLRRRLRLLTNGILSLATVPLVSVTMLIFASQTQVLTGIGLAFALLGIGLSIWLQRPYTRKLHDALLQRRLILDQGPQVIQIRPEALSAYLQHEDSELVQFVLRLLKGKRINLPAEQLKPLIFHENDRVREAALNVLAYTGSTDQQQLIVDMLSHESNPHIQRACLIALRYLGNEEQNELVHRFLVSADPEIQMESLVFLFTRGGIEGILSGAETLKQWLHANQPQLLAQAAYVIGEIGIRYFRQDFRQLLAHTAPEVQQAALLAAVQSLPSEMAGDLLPLMARHQHATLVRKALRQLPAAQIVPLALQTLYQHREDRSLMLELTRLIGTYSETVALEALIAVFAEPDIYLKYQVLQELSQLRRAHELDLSAYRPRILTQLQREFYYAYTYHFVLMQMHADRNTSGPNPSLAFVQAEIQLRLGFSHEMLFKLLGLLHPSREMEQAWLNFKSKESRYRSLSLEVLSYTLDQALLEPVLNLLDDVSYTQRVTIGREAGYIDDTIENWWQNPVITEDPWLQKLSRWSLQAKLPGTLTRKELQVFQIIDRMFLLKQTELFSSFSAEELYPVAQSANEMFVPARRLIFKQDQPGDAFYIIHKGRVSVERKGFQVTILEAKEGFGELEILNAAPRLATVRTLADCELLVISREDFIDLVEEYRGFGRSLLEVMSSRLSQHVLKLGATQPLSPEHLPG